VGSGALFIHIQPQKWIINDINDDLINVYNSIKSDAKQVVKNIKTFKTKTKFENISTDEKNTIMKKTMQNFIKLPYNTLRASNYLLLNMTSFKGALIVNGKYKFTGLESSIAHGSKPRIFNESYLNNLKDVSELLNSNGRIYNLDYKNILKKITSGSFCFIDSPYDEEHDYQFTYNITSKNKTNFVQELFLEVQKLDKKKVKWLMTQANTPSVRETYKQYTIIEYTVFRPFKQEYVTELIIKNY
jgi:DNA adenine methylase